MLNKKNNRGFTLVELIVVLSILTILAAIAIPTYIGYIDKSKEKICEVTRADVAHFAEAQRAADGGYYSTIPDATQGFREAVYNAYQIKMTTENKIVGLCPSGGIYSAEFGSATTYAILCSVHTDTLQKAIEYYKKNLDEMLAKSPTYVPGTDLIKEYYKSLGGKLPEVDPEWARNKLGPDKWDGRKLYWKPSLIQVNGKYTYVMFATDGNDDTHNKWKGYIAYYDGKYYKAKNLKEGGNVGFANGNVIGPDKDGNMRNDVLDKLNEGFVEFQK